MNGSHIGGYEYSLWLAPRQMRDELDQVVCSHKPSVGEIFGTGQTTDNGFSKLSLYQDSGPRDFLASSFRQAVVCSRW